MIRFDTFGDTAHAGSTRRPRHRIICIDMPKPSAEHVPSTDVVVAQTYFDVSLRADGIVWLERNAEVYPDVQAVHRAYDEFLAEVDDWALRRRIKSGNLGTKARSPLAWLFDVRAAPS